MSIVGLRNLQIWSSIYNLFIHRVSRAFKQNINCLNSLKKENYWAVDSHAVGKDVWPVFLKLSYRKKVL